MARASHSATLFMVNSIITYTHLIRTHPLTLNPSISLIRGTGEFGNLRKGVPTHKCLHISKIHHSIFRRVVFGLYGWRTWNYDGVSMGRYSEIWIYGCLKNYWDYDCGLLRLASIKIWNPSVII